MSELFLVIFTMTVILVTVILVTVILVTENIVKYVKLFQHSPNVRWKCTICLISGSLPEKPPSKNLPRKNFIAPNDSPSNFRGCSIGGLRWYLAPVTSYNGNGN